MWAAAAVATIAAAMASASLGHGDRVLERWKTAFAPAAAIAAHAPESIFQDDDHLIYADSATVAHTLDMLASLGVDRVRVTIEWKDIAPDPNSSNEPAGFDATDPADYTLATYGGSAGIWGPYDRVVQMAAARGIGVDFNLTAPAPAWAVQPAPVTSEFGTRPADHYDPSTTDFGQFVQAVGTRYSGTYVPPPPPPPPTPPSTNPFPITLPLPLTRKAATPAPSAGGTAIPRVDFWSIWNEPNQPGWLAPQWRTVGGQRVPDSPRLYRSLQRAAVAALYNTGHTLRSDTILVGETAPEGSVSGVEVGARERYYSNTGFYDAMSPLVFLRALYCVNTSYRRLTGTAASALGCPMHESAHGFVTRNPALFYAAGYAHHPYYFLFPPNYSSPDPDFVPLANLGRLERALNRIFASYGVNRRIPIYLTEYGYQTNPPDPYEVVSPARQAVYLNEADSMAWRAPRVRSVAQFLLYDAGPNSAYPPSSYEYWDTFQTGLMFGPGTSLSGRPKPAFTAYRLPIWIPDASVRRRATMMIWGMLRLAPRNAAQTALIRWRSRPGQRFRTFATVNVPVGAAGYFTTRVTPPGTGQIRIAWHSASGQTSASRIVGVTVR